MIASFRRHISCKIMALTVCFTFIWQSIGPIGEARAASLTHNKIDIASINLPDRFGEITDSYKGTLDKTIIHIRDAHCDYSAQNSISGAIGYFRDTYGVDSVALEGGAGSYDLSVFTDIKDTSLREKVADYFVKQGEVNGAEFYAINNPVKIALYGIEEPALYIENLNAYRDSLKFKDKAIAILRSMALDISKRKDRIYPVDFRELDKKMRLFKEDKLSFEEYASAIAAYSKKNNIDMSEYPNIGRFYNVIDHENAINMKEAERERNILIDLLNKRLSKKYLEELVAKTVEFNDGNMPAGEYYAYLLNKAELCGIELDKMQNLLKYAEAAKKTKAVNKKALEKEFKALEENMCLVFLKTDAQRALCVLDKQLFILEGLFSVSLVKDDWDYYLAHRKDFERKEFAGLNRYRIDMEKFYTLSLKRDDVFIDKVVDKLKKDNQKNIILVTGGFHQDNLKKLFKDKGYSYVEVLPKMEKCEGECPYFRLLSGGTDPIMKTLSERQSSLQIASFLSTMLSLQEREAFERAVKVVTGLIENNVHLDELSGIKFSLSSFEGSQLLKVNSEQVIVKDQSVYWSGPSAKPAAKPVASAKSTPGVDQSATPPALRSPTSSAGAGEVGPAAPAVAGDREPRDAEKYLFKDRKEMYGVHTEKTEPLILAASEKAGLKARAGRAFRGMIVSVDSLNSIMQKGLTKSEHFQRSDFSTIPKEALLYSRRPGDFSFPSKDFVCIIVEVDKDKLKKYFSSEQINEFTAIFQVRENIPAGLIENIWVLDKNNMSFVRVPFEPLAITSPTLPAVSAELPQSAPTAPSPGPQAGAWFRFKNRAADMIYSIGFATWAETFFAIAVTSWILPVSAGTFHAVLGGLIAAMLFWAPHIARGPPALFNKEVLSLTFGTFLTAGAYFAAGPLDPVTITAFMTITLLHLLINFKSLIKTAEQEEKAFEEPAAPPIELPQAVPSVIEETEIPLAETGRLGELYVGVRDDEPVPGIRRKNMIELGKGIHYEIKDYLHHKLVKKLSHDDYEKVIGNIDSLLNHLIPNAIDGVFERIDNGGLDRSRPDTIRCRLIIDWKNETFSIILADSGVGISKNLPEQWWMNDKFTTTKDKKRDGMFMGRKGQGVEIALNTAIRPSHKLDVSFRSRCEGEDGFEFAQLIKNAKADRYGDITGRELKDYKKDGIGTEVTISGSLHAPQNISAPAKSTPGVDQSPAPRSPIIGAQHDSAHRLDALRRLMSMKDIPLGTFAEEQKNPMDDNTKERLKDALRKIGLNNEEIENIKDKIIIVEVHSGIDFDRAGAEIGAVIVGSSKGGLKILWPKPNFEKALEGDKEKLSGLLHEVVEIQLLEDGVDVDEAHYQANRVAGAFLTEGKTPTALINAILSSYRDAPLEDSFKPILEGLARRTLEESHKNIYDLNDKEIRVLIGRFLRLLNRAEGGWNESLSTKERLTKILKNMITARKITGYEHDAGRHFDTDDLIFIVQRLHTLAKTFKTRAVVIERLPSARLRRIITDRIVSNAETYNILEEAGFAGTAWENEALANNESYIETFRALKSGDYGKVIMIWKAAWNMVREKPEKYTSVFKAIADFFKINIAKMEETFLDREIQQIEVRENKRLSDKEVMDILVATVHEHVIADLKVLVRTAWVASTMGIVSELAFAGRGADAIAISGTGAKGKVAIKAHIPKGNKFKPEDARRIGAVHKIMKKTRENNVMGADHFVENTDILFMLNPDERRQNRIMTPDQFNRLEEKNKREGNKEKDWIERIIEVNKFINGRSLKELIDRTDFYGVNATRMLDYAVQFVELNNAPAENDLVNRDIRNLANIIVDENGRLKLIDLGHLDRFTINSLNSPKSDNRKIFVGMLLRILCGNRLVPFDQNDAMVDTSEGIIIKERFSGLFAAKFGEAYKDLADEIYNEIRDWYNSGQKVSVLREKLARIDEARAQANRPSPGGGAIVGAAHGIPPPPQPAPAAVPISTPGVDQSIAPVPAAPVVVLSTEAPKEFFTPEEISLMEERIRILNLMDIDDFKFLVERKDFDLLAALLGIKSGYLHWANNALTRETLVGIERAIKEEDADFRKAIKSVLKYFEKTGLRVVEVPNTKDEAMLVPATAFFVYSKNKICQLIREHEKMLLDTSIVKGTYNLQKILRFISKPSLSQEDEENLNKELDLYIESALSVNHYDHFIVGLFLGFGADDAKYFSDRTRSRKSGAEIASHSKYGFLWITTSPDTQKTVDKYDTVIDFALNGLKDKMLTLGMTMAPAAPGAANGGFAGTAAQVTTGDLGRLAGPADEVIDALSGKINSGEDKIDKARSELERLSGLDEALDVNGHIKKRINKEITVNGVKIVIITVESDKGWIVQNDEIEGMVLINSKKINSLNESKAIIEEVLLRMLIHEITEYYAIKRGMDEMVAAAMLSKGPASKEAAGILGLKERDEKDRVNMRVNIYGKTYAVPETVFTNIRKAEKSDVKAIASLSSLIFTSRTSGSEKLEQATKEYGNNVNGQGQMHGVPFVPRIWVYTDEAGVARGYISVHITDINKNPIDVELAEIAVAEGMQNQKIGSSLWAYMMNEVQKEFSQKKVYFHGTTANEAIYGYGKIANQFDFKVSDDSPVGEERTRWAFTRTVEPVVPQLVLPTTPVSPQVDVIGPGNGLGSYSEFAANTRSASTIESVGRTINVVFAGEDYHIFVSGDEPNVEAGNGEEKGDAIRNLVGIEERKAKDLLVDKLKLAKKITHTIGLERAKKEAIEKIQELIDADTPQELISYTISENMLNKLETDEWAKAFKETHGIQGSLEDYLRKKTVLEVVVDHEGSKVYLMPYLQATNLGLTRLNLVNLLKSRDLSEEACRDALDAYCNAVGLLSNLSGDDIKILKDRLLSAAKNNLFNFFKEYTFRIALPPITRIDFEEVKNTLTAMEKVWHSL